MSGSGNPVAGGTGISVVVLTQGNRPELRHCLAGIRNQNPPVHEIIIVNNSATQLELGEAADPQHPVTRTLNTGGNFGTAARNVGAQAASGPYVVFLDDDVVLAQRDAAARILKAMTAPDGPCAISFKVVTPDTGNLEALSWCHPRDPALWQDSPFDTDAINEGAFTIAAVDFRAVGGFWPGIFIGEEGVDLFLRLLRAGKRVRYDPSIACIHLHSRTGRQPWRGFYHYARSGVLIAWRHLPLIPAMGFLLRTGSLLTVQSMRARSPAALFRALAGAQDGFCWIVGGRVPRTPLGKEELLRWRQLRSGRPSLLTRIRRQLRNKTL
jgi:GT2 family glycosyltransferase